MSNHSVVIVTGVSSGIGRITAEKFAQQGCVVFGTVRNIAKAQPIPGVEFVEMDVCNETSVQKGIQTIIDRANRIDVLVNNAGFLLSGSIEETSVTEATALFDTNVLGILRTTKAVLSQMRAQGSGRIVNISSVLGFLPAPYAGIYAASKHAVEGLSESLDHEVRQFGIRVVLVEPGFTKTNLDTNSPHAANLISAYDDERGRVAQAIHKNLSKAPEPDGVADTIIEAAFGKWKMRRPPKGQAALLSKLRRFMPAGAVDSSIRKDFGLG
jgi:short-subunit dehydrogenase